MDETKLSICWYEQNTNDLSVGNSSPERRSCWLADIGDIRLTLKKTSRATNNKWRLYLGIWTNEANGVKTDLKRGVCVAEYPGELVLGMAKSKAEEYLATFILRIMHGWTQQRGESEK